MCRPHSATVKGAPYRLPSRLRSGIWPWCGLPRRVLRGLCLFLLYCLCSAAPTQAMLWQWTPGGESGSERLLLVLDSPEQARSFARSGSTGMTLYLNTPAASLRQVGNAPAPGALLHGVDLAQGQIRIKLSPRVVNYAMRRPAPDRLEMEFFAAGPHRGEVGGAGEIDSPASVASAEAVALLPAPVSTGSALYVAAPDDSIASPPLDNAAFLADLLRRALNGAKALPYSTLAALTSRPDAKGAPVPEFIPRRENPSFWSQAAYAADATSELSGAQGPVELGDRGLMLSRQDVRAKVNAGGPEAWPEQQGLSTVTLPGSGQQIAAAPQQNLSPAAPAADSAVPLSAHAPEAAAPQTSSATEPAKEPGPAQASELAPSAPSAPSAPAADAAVSRPEVKEQGASASGRVNESAVGLPVGEKKDEQKEEAAPPSRPVIYVDEQGNPVPKPLEPDKILAEAERLIGERKFDEALPQLEKLRALTTITPEMREKVLYYISDCLWARYADNPLAGYEAIVSSTSEAMNADLRSPRVPNALLRLGLANLNVGNLVDAGGYIVALLRRYPDFPGVAQGFTAMGQAQSKRGLNAEAEQSFSIVLDKYPESSYLQEASVGLAHALYDQKKYDKAQIILDFISKRWPRYYITEPSFLLLQAGNDVAVGKIDAALAIYWLYINLDPTRHGNDAILLKMGDIYSRQDNTTAANFVYRELERRFPGTAAASTARLRLAEKGIYESPLNYERMSKVFNKASDPPLWQVYSDLAASSGTEPEAVLARLKQAMWLYWDKQYTEAMGKAADFIDAYPDNPDVPEAREIIWQAFQKELANSLAEQNYGRILILWNGFPLVRERYGDLDPRMRYALAQGWLERGDEAKALALMAEFLKSPMNPQYGEAAFTEFFNRYLKAGAWDKILDLGKLVSGWPMNQQLRNQLDYAMALSAQNLNLAAPALAMWKQLAARTDIPLYQRAYATYFLARDAEQRKDIKSSYDLNRQVIDLFTQLQDERSDKADPQRIKQAVAALMDICEVGNRIPEALQWVERYNAFVPDNSPEYPGLRFREARLYRKLGDATRAQALLEDIVRRFPDSPFAKAASGELRTFEVSRDLQNYMPGGAQPQAAPAQP